MKPLIIQKFLERDGKIKEEGRAFSRDKDCKKVDYYKRWNALLHGRDGEWMNAVIACLTECSLNKEGINTVIDARQCEKDCNGQYMNIHTMTSSTRLGRRM